jgi:hypothetical protein
LAITDHLAKFAKSSGSGHWLVKHAMIEELYTVVIFDDYELSWLK